MNLSQVLHEKASVLDKPQGLYINIPFCTARCAYCDFHSFVCSAVSERSRADYIEALFLQLDELEKILGTFQFRTIYIGGGTPTSLEDVLFLRLLGELRTRFGRFAEEWTVEANPETLSDAKLNMLGENGCTRISLGVQSLDEAELHALGRKASAEASRTALERALKSGLKVSADVISGIPFSLQEGSARKPALLSNVEYLIKAGVQHISMYDLIVEQGTRIEQQLTRGLLILPDEDAMYEERKAAEAILAQNGYYRYEISNFARPHEESLHNQIYWSMESWIGLGSGAVSSLNASGSDNQSCATVRFEGDRNLDRFLTQVSFLNVEPELVTPSDAELEMIMMGLRTRQGLDAMHFQSRFGRDPRALIANTLEKWAEYYIPDSRFVRLSDRGMDLLNRILVDCMDEIQN